MTRLAAALRAATIVLYRLALRRYPRRLRDRWGEEMAEAARRLLEEETARRGPILGTLATWLRLLRDLARPLPGSDRRPALGSAVAEDLGFAWRSLRRDPRFSLLLVGVLGVGLGLNVAVLSVVRAYLLRPLPYPQADRIVQVQPLTSLSWREVDEVLDAPVSWDLDVFVMVGDGRPETIRGAWVTPSFQELYGVRPAMGRGFVPADAEAGRPPVALISHGLWVRRFGASPEVLGRSFQAFTSDRPDHAESFSIVGVLPPDFWHVNPYTDVLAPLQDDRPVYGGRLRPDVPRARAEEALTELARARTGELPPGGSVRLVPLQDAYTESVRPTLVTLQAAVLAVLLIACANGAVLLLVRASRRQRELGVRQALGAPRLRLWRQLLGEGLLLAGGAGVVGTLLAAVLVGSLAGLLEGTLLTTSVPGGAEAIRLDGPVLAGCLALVTLVGLVFGVLPLAVATRGALADRVLGALRSREGGRRQGLLRRGMVAAEVALSLALLVAAGLMVRSAAHLNARDLGFQAERVVGAQVGLRQASYPELADRANFFRRFLDAVRQLPGVESAGLVGFAPMSGRATPRRVQAEAGEGMGGPDPEGGAGGMVESAVTAASSGYPAALGIPLLRGRGFAAEDREGTEPVVLVSEEVAARLWPGTPAVGRRVRVLDPLPGTETDTTVWRTVVGVVGEVAAVPGSETTGDVYLPLRQATGSWMTLLVRTRPGAGPVVPAVESALAALDSEVPLSRIYRVEERARAVRAPTAALAWLLGGFALFAGLLAVLGLYGVVAYAARQQRRSLAIRMALGADGRRVRRHFLGQGAATVLVGLVAGAPLALLLGHLLAGRLHGVSPGDPGTHLGMAGLLLATALLAVWLPARRASRTEPMGVLREE